MSAVPLPSARIAMQSEPILRLRGIVGRCARDEPVFLGLGLLLAAAIAPTLFAAAIDPRLIAGENPWIKPLRFELALALYTVTLALYARWVPGATLSSRRYRVFRGAVVAAILIEMAWIAGAAAIGTRSHFNTSPIGAVIYPMMGLLAILLTSASTVYGIAIARNKASGLPPAIRDGLVLGLLMTLPLTLVAVVPLSSGLVPSPPETASTGSTFALFNWAKPGGALHVAHFLGAHALHALPIFAVVAAAVFGSAARWPVRAFATLYVAVVVGIVAFSLQSVAG